MSIDFQQVRHQVIQLGERAPQRQRYLKSLRTRAKEVLEEYADSISKLREKVENAAALNLNLRTALPVGETLNARFSNPEFPASATLLAADGSQINPDRHASVDYCLVNVGAIQLVHGSTEAPKKFIRSRLLYDEQMYTENGRITERLVALLRDLDERRFLADLAEFLPKPVITLADGPLELWIGRESDLEAKEFERSFREYLDTLDVLRKLEATTAGYIDKPRSDLFIRLLEIADLSESDLDQAGRQHRPFRGLTDVDLFNDILGPNQRSAVFKIRSRNSGKYTDELALHFFYINVGKTSEGQPYLARVEIPNWVATSTEMLDNLHAVLIHQCRILGSRPYPYLLHRSHEVAVVSQDERKQLENMIALELRRRGISPEGKSFKISHKEAWIRR